MTLAGTHPSAPPPVRTLVVDFDGTICPQDVSEELLRRFADPSWWQIDLEFQRGAIGSRECLIRQARLVRASHEELLEAALGSYRLEPSFGPFVGWCRDRGIRLVVASDGFGFYLGPMLEGAGIEGIEVRGNDVRFEPEPAFAFPNAHGVCVGCGTCKLRVVLEARARGPVGFVGEGHTDRYGALSSDVVFAKKALAPICEADGVPYLPWETFDDVRAGLEGLAELPGPVDPPRCPGWRTA